MSTTKKQIDTFHPDMVEIMPGVMPKALEEIRRYTNIPIIAGGLISDKKDIMVLLTQELMRSLRPGKSYGFM